MLYKNLIKSRTFRIDWEGQINLSEKGLQRLLENNYKQYLKKLKIKEIKVK